MKQQNLYQGSAFGSGGLEPHRAESSFRAAGTRLGLDAPARLGLKVSGQTINEILGQAGLGLDFLSRVGLRSADTARFELKVCKPGQAARMPTHENSLTDMTLEKNQNKNF